MRVLVTGGLGAIGSHLADALLDRGDEVTVLDNLLTGRAENLAHRAGEPRLTVVTADVRDPLPAALAGRRFDRIYHLASPASPVDYRRHPVDTLMTNALGTQRMLDLAAASGARFLLASTSEVYGDPLVHPQAEEYRGNVDPRGPRSCYDEGKRFAESLTATRCREEGIDARIARLFNCYGERSRPDDGRVVPAFCVQALRGEPLTIHGDGSQTRTLCHVSDTVRGLIALMETPGLAGEAVNIGSPEEVTVLEIAARVARLAGSASPLGFAPLPPDDPRRRCPDISRARRLLGWEPAVGLDDGLSRTLAWFRERGVSAGSYRAPA